MKELLTRNECTAMRGIAILAIVLHNYCHFISKIVQENEYQFFVSHNEQLWQVVTNPDALLPVHLLSFFGHYGVPVFLFLSGYGLVRKYETSDDSCPPVRFVRYNYLKLLRMLIVGFSLFICVDMVTPGRFQFHWDNVIAQLLMYINVLPEPEKTIWPGIYWFFGLMMELYIVYRLLLYRRSWWIVVALIAICWLLQARLSE
jgi:peptidoglycan/LPS O-acetylase OafA/YrhL